MASRPGPVHGPARPGQDQDGKGPGGTGPGRSGPGRPGPGRPGPGRPGPGRPGPGRSGPGGPEEAAERARTASQRTIAFSLLVLGALLGMRLPLPWQLVGVLFSLAAITAGVLAVVAVWRSGPRSSVVFLGAGLLLAGFVLLTQLAALVLWPLQTDLQDCLASAVTQRSQAQCQDAFEQDVTSWTERMSRLGQQ